MILVALQMEFGEYSKENVRADHIMHTMYKRPKELTRTIKTWSRRSNCEKVAMFNDGPTGDLFRYVPDTYRECYQKGTVTIV